MYKNMQKNFLKKFHGTYPLRLRDYTVGAWFSHPIQPPVATTLLHSPRWKQHSMKPVILASIAHAERSTTHAVANLWRLLPSEFSCQKSDLAQKIHCCCLRSLCTAATSSKLQKLLHLAFTAREKSGKKRETQRKNDLVSTFWPNNFLTLRHFEKGPVIY